MYKYAEKKCLSCGGIYTPNSSSQKYCKKCSIKKCIVCGSKCHEKANKYCSMGCYKKHRFGKGESVCVVCGGNLGNNARFCSAKCRKDYWNKNDYVLNKKQKMRDRKDAIIKALGGKCVNCGISDVRVLDINHIDRHKKGMAPNRQFTTARRLKEWSKNLSNLELLCANCHRIHTWEQMGYGK